VVHENAASGKSVGCGIGRPPAAMGTAANRAPGFDPVSSAVKKHKDVARQSRATF